MKERIKDWLFLVTAIGIGMYLCYWLNFLTLLLLREATRAPLY